MKSYKDLLVWQKSIELVALIYKYTQEFPKEEAYGLTSQMRRCAVSIPSNIAEGYERNSQAEFRRFLRIAKGSSGELRTQFYIAKALKLESDEIIDTLLQECVELSSMIQSLINKIEV